ncbi:MAG: PorT family protein [Saprospiraceae bacterium]|nr:PorT family protein [Saprospiraceae bacterium]
MAKWVLFAVLFLSWGATEKLTAQRFKAGIIGGFNISQIDGDKLGGFNQPGIHAGGRVAALMGKRWQLGVEMLYSQQGSQRVRTDDPLSNYERIRLNFVEVPVLIHFSDWKFRLGAGFSYARLINYKIIDYSGADITDFQELNPDIFSIVLGVTFNFTEKWGLDVRWSRYLNNLQADKEDAPFFGRSIGIRGIYSF